MTPPATSWNLGLDLGQRRDYSALATLSCEWTTEGRDPVTWEWKHIPRLILRDLERFPLGTSYVFYPEAVERRVTQIDALTPAYGQRRVSLVVDAGGPGAPVVDEFRRARLDLELRPLIITAGNEPNTTAAGTLTAPRKVLISNLIILVDHKKLVAPAGLSSWDALVEEMLELNASTSQPLKTTAHDDMVMALALAAWQATRENPELLPERKKARAYWSPTGSLF
jgi:hypothetical protein